jgi:O-antigen/teichoic acid export membrane protein
MLKLLSPGIKLIASNTFYQLLSKFITMSITFALTYLISKNYGAYGYGLFAIFQSFPALFYIISDFGLNAIGALEISKNEKKGSEILSNILVLRLILSLFLMVICLILAFYLYPNEELRFGIALGSLIIVAQTLVATTNIVYQLKLRYDISALSNVISYIFILLGALYFINNQVSVVFLNFLYVIGTFLAFGLNFYFLKKFDIKIKLKYEGKYLSKLALLSWPLGLMFVFSQINFKADSILLSILPIPNLGLTNIETTGVYALPYKIFEVMLVLPTFLMNSTYPLLLKSMQNGFDKLKNNFKKTVFFMCGIGAASSLVLFVGVWFFLTPDLISLIFDSEFVYSRDILLILFSGIFLFFLTQPLAWFLVIIEKQRYLPFIYGFSAILNVSLNLIFIPQYSFYASSVITLVTEGVILVLLLGVFFKFWFAKNAS